MNHSEWICDPVADTEPPLMRLNYHGLPKTPRAVNYDDILLELGEFGLWQKNLSAIFWIPPLVGGAVFLLGSFAGPNIF